MQSSDEKNLWRIIRARDQCIRDLRAQLQENYLLIAELRRRLNRQGLLARLEDAARGLLAAIRARPGSGDSGQNNPR